MKKIIIAVLFMVPAIAFADTQNNVGSCGWGSKLFEGQHGVPPQIFAATTNGSTGNQTFGISSGTSGCTQDGAVTSTWKTAMFIDGNKERLARDMSTGNGESLDSLAHLIGVRDADRAKFNQVLQENFSRIFPSENVSTEQIVVELKNVLASDQQLAQYAASV
ncbi:MAG TPA: DUF3015 domain-containing protein [Burkholderiales bacterium]|nr:DUF3015 domain-containing protein [Burkholderiales bacterium]